MSAHRPVMLEEALAGLAVRPGGTYVDGTYGRGGHSAAILEALAGSGALHALDRDPDAGAHARREHPKVQTRDQNFHFHARNFAEVGALAGEVGIAGKIDGLLLDLGVSSPQFDQAARGFSFSQNGPLDMRMDPRSGESAAEWLAHAKETDIADVLFQYGEERNSRRIARRIVETRSESPLKTTAQLAALIASVPGPRSHKIHPATRSFQAIRIHINGELAALEAALSATPTLFAVGGRLAVISFHSLEDRIVKRFIRDSGRRPESAMSQRELPALEGSVLKAVGRYFPSDEEADSNPRARSAVLRVAERVQ